MFPNKKNISWSGTTTNSSASATVFAQSVPAKTARTYTVTLVGISKDGFFFKKYFTFSFINVAGTLSWMQNVVDLAPEVSSTEMTTSLSVSWDGITPTIAVTGPSDLVEIQWYAQIEMSDWVYPTVAG